MTVMGRWLKADLLAELVQLEEDAAYLVRLIHDQCLDDSRLPGIGAALLALEQRIARVETHYMRAHARAAARSEIERLRALRPDWFPGEDDGR